jgi:hypothetical protein
MMNAEMMNDWTDKGGRAKTLEEADSSTGTERLRGATSETSRWGMVIVYELKRQFWLGDLNYRVEVPDDILSAWVAEGKYGQILEKDQVSSRVLQLT